MLTFRSFSSTPHLTVSISMSLAVVLLSCSFMMLMVELGVAAQQNTGFTLFPLFSSNITAAPIYAEADDTATARMDAYYKFTGVTIFHSKDQPFSVESFRAKVLDALPVDWVPHKQKFADRLLILEYCTWPAKFHDCRSISFREFQSFLFTSTNLPVCHDRRFDPSSTVASTSDAYGAYPFLKPGAPQAASSPADLTNFTLVRFAFNGADRSEYYTELSAFRLGACGLTGNSYALDFAAAQSLDIRVVPRSTPLPSSIVSTWQKLTRFFKRSPANAEALGAVIIILVVFVLGFCLYKYLTRWYYSKKLDNTKPAMTQQEMGAAAAAARYGPDAGSSDAGGVMQTGLPPSSAPAGGAAAAARRRLEAEEDEFEMVTARLSAAAAKAAERAAAEQQHQQQRHHASSSSSSSSDKDHASGGMMRPVPPEENGDDDDGSPGSGLNNNGSSSFDRRKPMPLSSDAGPSILFTPKEERPVLLAPPTEDDEAVVSVMARRSATDATLAPVPAADAAAGSDSVALAQSSAESPPPQPSEGGRWENGVWVEGAAAAAGSKKTTIDDVFA